MIIDPILSWSGYSHSWMRPYKSLIVVCVAHASFLLSHTLIRASTALIHRLKNMSTRVNAHVIAEPLYFCHILSLDEVECLYFFDWICSFC